MKVSLSKIKDSLEKPVHIAPLAMFRFLFGGIMLISIVRFALNGWIYDLYIEPQYHFTYFGFEWVKAPGDLGMYLIFALMGLAAFGVMIGAFYRWSASLFFLSFTYVELIDKTNYLNHYYFVSIIAFLLVLVPAGSYFSFDSWKKGTILEKVPRWQLGIFRLQLGMVYFFAGIAKLNPDWLFLAQPLKTWLPAKSHLPLIGPLLKIKLVAYIFSWFGALYDLFIPFLLSFRRSRPFAYLMVIGFHVMTWLLFQIGMFPFIMILSTLVFFSTEWHLKRIKWIESLVNRSGLFVRKSLQTVSSSGAKSWRYRVLVGIVSVHFILQLLLPFRYVLYPGKLFWTEQGYRFSWRVMLMEKAGYAIFRVRDPETGHEAEIYNLDYLSPNQEKMMSTQPDMILQFAHFIDHSYRKKGIKDPEVRAEVYVTLNGSGSRLFIDPERDLSLERETFGHKDWILPFERNDNYASKQ